MSVDESLTSSSLTQSGGAYPVQPSVPTLRGRRGFALNPLVNLPLNTPTVPSSSSEGVESPSKSFHSAYELGNVLGAGAMSVVRIATRKSDGKLLAVKCIHTEDEELIDATRREYSLLRGARHPSIVRVEALHQGRQSLWLSMELCDGGSLDARIRRVGVLKEGDASRMFLQLLQGVDFLHSKRVVHRDIKPANLLLQGDLQRLKITDFNCAKQVGFGTVRMLTERGTHNFNAPELRFGRHWNERIDIWSSGLCLYFMLRGELALNIMDRDTAKFIIQFGRLPPVCWEHVPNLLQNLVLQCLAVESCDRPPAMELLMHPALAIAKQQQELREGVFHGHQTTWLEFTQSSCSSPKAGRILFNSPRLHGRVSSGKDSVCPLSPTWSDIPKNRFTMLPSCGLVAIVTGIIRTGSVGEATKLSPLPGERRRRSRQLETCPNLQQILLGGQFANLSEEPFSPLLRSDCTTAISSVTHRGEDLHDDEVSDDDDLEDKGLDLQRHLVRRVSGDATMPFTDSYPKLLVSPAASTCAVSSWRERRSGVDSLHRLAEAHCERTARGPILQGRSSSHHMNRACTDESEEALVSRPSSVVPRDGSCDQADALVSPKIKVLHRARFRRRRFFTTHGASTDLGEDKFT